MAFHPNFTQNGRFFVSDICDGAKAADCKVVTVLYCTAL